MPLLCYLRGYNPRRYGCIPRSGISYMPYDVQLQRAFWAFVRSYMKDISLADYIVVLYVRYWSCYFQQLFPTVYTRMIQLKVICTRLVIHATTGSHIHWYEFIEGVALLSFIVYKMIISSEKLYIHIRITILQSITVAYSILLSANREYKHTFDNIVNFITLPLLGKSLFELIASDVVLT